MPFNSRFLSLRRLPWLGAPLLNTLLLLALAALLAHWTWRFAAPVPPRAAAGARADIQLGAELATLRAARLFGAAPAQPGGPVEQVTSLNLKLHGVFAAMGGLAAMAILGVDGQDQAVSTGNEIVPGVVLDAVAPDHVILLNRGVRERLDLDPVGRPLTLADGDIPLSRQDINQALASPQTLGVQAKASTDGKPGLLLTAVDGNGLAARLGLQGGDMLRMVNGTPVEDVQDFAELLPGTANLERVTLVAERQGKPLTLTFKLQ
jgi:general secretion pathway protein C